MRDEGREVLVYSETQSCFVVRCPALESICNAHSAAESLQFNYLQSSSRRSPQLDEVRGAIEEMIHDGKRASDIVKGLRASVKRAELLAGST